MPLVANSFEGGTNGVAVTTANSGGTSGDAFNAVAGAVAGATLAYSATEMAHGSLALQVATAATAGTQWVGYTTSFGTNSDFYLRFNLYLTALPAASATLWRGFSGAATLCSLNMNTSGQLRVQDSLGVVVSGSTSGALPTGQWVRVELHITMSTTVGQTELRVYHSVDSTVATFSAQSTATLNLGATSADGYRMGLQTTQANYGPTWFDDYALSTTTWLGPAAASNVPPTVSVTAPDYWPLAETVTASASAADTDGTIATYAWTMLSEPPGSGATLTTPSASATSFVPLIEGDYTLECSVTDNLGGVGADSRVIHITAAQYVWNGSAWVPGYEQTYNGTTWG